MQEFKSVMHKDHPLQEILSATNEDGSELTLSFPVKKGLSQESPFMDTFNKFVWDRRITPIHHMDAEDQKFAQRELERIKLAVSNVTIRKQLAQFGNNKKLRQELALNERNNKRLYLEIKRLHKSIIVEPTEETTHIEKSRINPDITAQGDLNSSI